MDKLKSHQWVNVTICVAIVTLLPTGITETMQSQQEREILASTEIPVDHIDPGSIDLTPLINALLNATNTDSQHLFSVLSVTSHSSLALHKITLLVYNISDFQDIETSTFPLRYCYCVTNKTNDLTDFTAILLDVMGNSTSYLQELFKSSSFLSVSQRKSSDCIYICVLAGKTDRDLTELWDSVSPLFNQTFIETTHKGNISFLELSFDSSTDFSSSLTTHSTISVPSQSSAASKVASSAYIPSTVPTSGHMTSFHTAVPSDITLTTVTLKTPLVTPIIPISPAVPMTTQLPSPTESAGIAVATTTTRTHVSMATETPVTTATSRSAHSAAEIPPKTSAATPTSPATSKAFHTEEPGCPWRSELFYRRSQRGLTEDPNETLDEDLSGNSPTISTIKLQPCVFELCKFFSQCLCRGLNRKSTQWRYCVSSHFWYEKHTVEICSRVKRVAFSKNLKQKCLTRMCGKI